MIIIMPMVPFTLDSFISQMSADDIKDLIGRLYEPNKKIVHLKMPKFSVRSSFSLTNVLLKVNNDIFFNYLSTNNFFKYVFSLELSNCLLSIPNYHILPQTMNKLK